MSRPDRHRKARPSHPSHPSRPSRQYRSLRSLCCLTVILRPSPRYVLVRKIVDVSEALERFLLADLLPKMSSEATQNSNQFRYEYCYSEEVDDVFRHHEASLRAIFVAYAKGDGPNFDGISSTSLMSYAEWLDLLKTVRQPPRQR